MTNNSLEESFLNQTSGKIIDAAYRVHSRLGPGLLESIYEKCLKYELKKRGLLVESQYSVPLIYDGQKIESDLKIDLLVENNIVIALKSVDLILAIHKAQLMSYLKLSQKRLGLLLNFNVPVIKSGITRILI